MTYEDVVQLDAPTLADIVEEALQYAKRLLQMDGALIPAAFLFTEEGDIALVAMPFNNDHEKLLCRTALKDMVKKLNAVAVIFISEAWCALVDKGVSLAELSITGVANLPNRQEALIVVGVTRDNLSYKASQTFQRKEEDFIFGNLESTSTPAVFDALVDNLWDQGTIH